MPNSVVFNGQKLDLSANPDLLFHILITLTNLEEMISSIDKRVHNLEKKSVILNDDNLVNYDSKKSQYFVPKRVTP